MLKFEPNVKQLAVIKSYEYALEKIKKYGMAIKLNKTDVDILPNVGPVQGVKIQGLKIKSKVFK